MDSAIPIDSLSPEIPREAEKHSQWYAEQHRLISENARLQEALVRARERSLNFIQYCAALQAVEVVAERRYLAVAPLLRLHGLEAPMYPHRLGDDEIRRETEHWRTVLTERWLNMEAAEEAMFLPKDGLAGKEDETEQDYGPYKRKRVYK